jgi:hypothetical protein
MYDDMRRSDVLVLAMAAGALLSVLSSVDAVLRARTAQNRLERSGEMVVRLALTDLALFTEARYTRHLSQADRHSAFQDHPTALDHFPSGALVAPPGY